MTVLFVYKKETKWNGPEHVSRSACHFTKKGGTTTSPVTPKQHCTAGVCLLPLFWSLFAQISLFSWQDPKQAGFKWNVPISKLRSISQAGHYVSKTHQQQESSLWNMSQYLLSSAKTYVTLTKLGAREKAGCGGLSKVLRCSFIKRNVVIPLQKVYQALFQYIKTTLALIYRIRKKSHIILSGSILTTTENISTWKDQDQNNRLRNT